MVCVVSSLAIASHSLVEGKLVYLDYKGTLRPLESVKVQLMLRLHDSGTSVMRDETETLPGDGLFQLDDPQGDVHRSDVAPWIRLVATSRLLGGQEL